MECGVGFDDADRCVVRPADDGNFLFDIEKKSSFFALFRVSF